MLSPAIGCSTFGSEERIRVPSPAASTTVRLVRSDISSFWQLKPSRAVIADEPLGTKRFAGVAREHAMHVPVRLYGLIRPMAGDAWTLCQGNLILCRTASEPT